MPADTTSRIVQQRLSIYAFFKRIYEKELSGEFLSELPGKVKSLSAITQVLPDAETREAVKALAQFAETIPPQGSGELETRLAADYARLFLSINKVPPHPSESTYRDGTMMQFSRDEALGTYWSFGVDKKKEFAEPEDHIAVELGFMMYLCEKTIEALNNGDTGEAGRYLQGQKDFLEKHLTRWVPRLVADIVKTGRTPFYKVVAVLTSAYLEIDLSATEDLLAQVRK